MRNANRGIYLGNRTGRGTVTNNLIVHNGSGISAFGRADYAIANNVIVNNQYVGIDMRDSCLLSIRNNVLAKNQRGIALYKEGTENFNAIGKNAYWANATDVENMDKPAGSVAADPQFADPNRGDFTVRGPVQERGYGLTNPSVIRELWEKLRQLPRSELIESSMRDGVQDGFNMPPAEWNLSRIKDRYPETCSRFPSPPKSISCNTLLPCAILFEERHGGWMRRSGRNVLPAKYCGCALSRKLHEAGYECEWGTAQIESSSLFAVGRCGCGSNVCVCCRQCDRGWR